MEISPAVRILLGLGKLASCSSFPKKLETDGNGNGKRTRETSRET